MVMALFVVSGTWLWGPLMLILLFIIGIYFTLCLRCMQFKKFFKAEKLTYVKCTGFREDNITPLQSQLGAVGGRIGNRNPGC